ncbi:MAG TPA: sialidase family protein [Terriglobia bacterium]|nr:sialidase family protein [Terriglobia bacterium]
MDRRSFCRNALLLPGLLAGRRAFAQTHDHAAMTAGDGEFNPFVVSDHQDGFLIAFVARKEARSDVFFQRALTGGGFSEPVRVNNRPGDGAVRNENPPKIAVGQAGEIYVVWASERERWKGDIRFARSLNGGKSFEPAIELNSGAAGPAVGRAFESIAVDTQGRIFVAWIDERNKKESDRGAEIWMTVSEDRGKSFQPDRRILSNVCECCRTALATDPAGTIFITYRTVPQSGPMFRDIGIARSSDGGRSFQTSIVNHDGWEINACPIAGATLAIDSAGRIHVVWFTQSGETPRLHIASSSDHGASFSKPDVFDPDQKVAKHAHAVVTRDNRLLIAWDDTNGGPIVKWGLYDAGRRSMKQLGMQAGASYPIAAANATRFSVVALQPDRPEVFRSIRVLGSSSR